MMIFKRKRVRTPTMIQMEAVECGAAALGIILAYYGKYIPLEQLRIDCGVSRDGSLAINIVRAARRYGLESTGYKIDFADLPSTPFPMIVFWEFNHFLVVEGITSSKVYLNDPASGPRTVSLEEFAESYTGIALTFKPTEEFQKGGKPLSLFKMLKSRMQQCSLPLSYLFLTGLCLLIPGIALPTFIQIFVDEVLVKHLNETAPIILLGLAVALLATGVLTWLQGYFLNRLNGKLSIRLSSQFLWHILRLPAEFYKQRFGGEIANRLQTNDIAMQILTGQIGQTAINVLLVIVYGIVMLMYDTLIGCIGIGATVVNLCALIWVNRMRIDSQMRFQQDYGKKIGISIGGLQTIETIKATASESDFYARWAGYYAKTFNALKDTGKLDMILTTIPPFTQAFGMGAVLIIGGLRVIQGEMTIGMLFALQTLMGTFLRPIAEFVYLGQNLQNLRGELTKLDDVLNNPIDPQLSLYASKGDNKKLRGELELKNITFGYNKLAPPLLDHFNLHLHPGKSIALVGPSGCGKSSIARLVTGLYLPWEGEILFDGNNVSAYPRETLNRSLGAVDQQIFFFGGTVKDNLTLWDATIPESTLLRAAQDACIHEDIMQRENGYDGKLLEGAHNFSGGQKQRLEIARVLALNPSLLILDEATSALDSDTEEEIIKNIRQRGCSCLIIAHRLSTIRDCDEIIILEKGKVMQRGSHEALKSQPGLYQDLVQLEGVAHEP